MKSFQELTIEIRREEIIDSERIDSETLKKVAIKIFENNKVKFLEYLEEKIKKELQNNKGNDDDISIPILDESFYELINSEIKKLSKIPINTIKPYEIGIYNIIRDNLKCELLASGYMIKSRSIILRKKSTKKKLKDMILLNYFILGCYVITYIGTIYGSGPGKEILNYVLKIKLIKFSICLLMAVFIMNNLICIARTIIDRESEELKPILKEMVDLFICTVIVIIGIYIYNQFVK